MADEQTPGNGGAPKPGDTPPSEGPTPAAPTDAPAAAVSPAAAPTSDAAKPAVPAVAAKPKPKPKPKAPPEAPKGPTDPPPPDDLERPAYVVALQEALPDAVEALSYWVGDWTVIVPATALLDVARFLRDDDSASFDYCCDVTASDWPPREQRFDVIYCLYSIRRRHRIRVKVRAAETEAVPSVTDVWPAANWLEREMWDMFGVNVTGHPDLRRILMPDNWQGFPQRKDYPLEGPGELLLESPMEWLRLRNMVDETEIE
jgi:NADH-quinone oxidoreductase subunit C